MAKLCLFAGWVVLAFVVFATLAPIYDRPAIAPPHVEHFAAFFMLGLLFVLAYPNRIILVLLIVVGSALTLETLQLLTPDRHGRLIDASIKVAGGLSGVALLVLARATAIQTKAKIASRG